MPTRFHLRLPNPALARGSVPELAFHSNGAEGLADELQDALRSPRLFERWRVRQEDPEAIDPALGISDPQAKVSGEQHDLGIELIVVTDLPGTVFKHRLRLLAGSHWQLRDVSAA
jgi:hypothetical protein